MLELLRYPAVVIVDGDYLNYSTAIIRWSAIASEPNANPQRKDTHHEQYIH